MDGSPIVDSINNVIAIHKPNNDGSDEFQLNLFSEELPLEQTSDAWDELCNKSKMQNEYEQAAFRCGVAVNIKDENYSAFA